MVTISTRAHIDPILQTLGRMQLEQAPWAIRWTNRVLAREVVEKTQHVIKQRFYTSPRGLRFLQSQVRVLGPNTVMGRVHRPRGGFDGSMSAVVGVVPREGKGQHGSWMNYRGSLLPMMEEGGMTPGPRDFGGSIGFGRYAVPVRHYGDRRAIPLKLYPINLGLQARRSIAGPLKAGALRGKERTYLIRTGPHAGMIFQRYGKERDATMPLFATVAQTRLPARHFFYPTARAVVDQRFALHFRYAMRQALFGRGSYRG
jgi:hypothetical protein